MSVKRAAVEYEVPKSTLQDRILGKVIHGPVLGVSRSLPCKIQLVLVFQDV